MASGRVSPTATLLRNSRLFSLPPPLPRPSQEVIQRYGSLDSPTATALYPTRAAIQTTRSSLARGDWGLKQSLPSKTIGRTSNSTIRIGDIETIDHITDFESANDLTMTLLKFQELELPITRPQQRPHRASASRELHPATSVFESKLDNIEPKEGDRDSERWKFKGSWIALENEGVFQKQIKKSISRQKTAFRELLRERLARKESMDRRERAINEGKDASQNPVEITDQYLDYYIRHLRSDPKQLRAIVEEFLDLPRIIGSSAANSLNVERNYAISGPPKTHPSAGLSYLRTASRIQNHPILGPQDIKRPVQGRFLVPQTSATGRRRHRALVGVGGIIADDSYIRFAANGQPAGSATFDPDTTTGHKFWFQPERATILNNGRIRLHLERVKSSHNIIYNGIPAEEPERRDETPSPEGSRSFTTSSPTWPLGHPFSLAPPDSGLADGTKLSRPTSYGRAQPFDATETREASVLLNLGSYQDR